MKPCFFPCAAALALLALTSIVNPASAQFCKPDAQNRSSLLHCCHGNNIKAALLCSQYASSSIARMQRIKTLRDALWLSLRSAEPQSATTKAQQDIVPLVGKTIVVDAGHGGKDSGATRGGIEEKNLCLAIVLKLKQRLLDQGIRVIMIRDKDVFVELDDRVKMTNQAHPDIFVSVHINSSNNSVSRGIEVYYYTRQSERLSWCIYRALVSGLRVVGRGVHKEGFRVIKHVTAPAVLAEVGYTTNTPERTLLADSKYQERIAEAVVAGINQFFASASNDGTP
ncbi:MAG: N-acetylmuramoyl-L-alanine amidase [Candidatus Melainabacteria bacterium]|nr:N-acetylmuramoyl-L-alanine amidase [Candidatus Melainabacteria bacterium]